jgi:hypothetical protein
MRPKIFNIPKAELEAFERTKRDALALHIPVTDVRIKLEAFDRNGKLVQELNTRSHSWTRNAYNQLFCELAGANTTGALYQAGALGVKTTAGILRGSTTSMPIFCSRDATAEYYSAGAGNAGGGIVVGSGTNAESFEDFVLQTPIANGSGAGQMAYAASEAYALNYDAGTRTYSNTFVRYMNNNSGGDVSVNEVGLILTNGSVSGYPSNLIWLQSREHLVATVIIPNYGQLKVTYVISLVFPA